MNGRPRISRTLLFLLLFGICPLLLHAKKDEEGKVSAVEDILEFIENGSERELVAERLERFLVHPLDLNAATAEELADLPFLDDFAIRNLLLHRSRHSGFRSVYELKEVQGMPVSLLPLLEPFITVGPSPYRSAYSRPARQALLLGSSFVPVQDAPAPALLLRYEGEKGEWAWHLAMEKDKGEAWLPLRRGGFDFLTGSLSWSADSAQLVVGDYRVTTGQGLLLGQSLSYFSSIEYGGTASAGLFRLRPHRSFRETGYLRGLAGRMAFGGFSLLAFAGYEPVDARTEGSRIRTLYATGLHREEDELLYRHTARRETAGGYLSFDPGTALHLGLTALGFRYRRSSDGAALLPPAAYGQEKITALAALDFRYAARRWQIFGESTLRPREAIALQGGAAYKDERLGTITLQGRYYGPKNYTPYGRPDGYSSTGRDEKGLRIIWNGEVAPWTTGVLYFDRFSSLGDSAEASQVVTGKITYLNGSTLLAAYARYIRRAGTPMRWSLTLRGRHQIGKRLTLQAEPRISKTPDEPLSYALSGRLRYSDGSIVADLSLQYFDLGGNTVVRGYSPYMPMMYGSSMLRGKGWFVAGGARYAVSESLKLNFRASRLYYPKGERPSTTLIDLSLSLTL